MISWAHGNAWIVIGAWILGSIIAFAAAVSFSQIARRTKNSNVGIGQLTEEMVGKKLGWHTKINWAFFYFPWNTVLIALYSSDYILKIASNNSAGASSNTLIALCVALGLLLIFLTLNVVWKQVGAKIQISATIIKVIPLIILALGAFVVVFIMPNTNWWNGTHTSGIDPTLANDTKGMNPFLIIVFIIPGTLFAYDSFINATNLSESVKKKHITYAIVGGMAFIAIIYLLVTIAILSTGTLNAEDALIKLFGGNPANPNLAFIVIKKIIQLFILISALGGLNGFCLVWTKTMTAVVKKKTTGNIVLGMSVSLLTIGLPLMIITLIIYISNYIPPGAHPSSAGKHIGITFADALSNPLIIISYTIYAITLLFAVWRNWKIKNKSKKFAKWFNYAAILSGVMILLVLAYIFFYSILYKALSSHSSTFGGVPGWVFLIIVTTYVILWFVLPFIVKKISKNFVIDQTPESKPSKVYLKRTNAY